MTEPDKNRDLVSYYCTKHHTFRGKYKRVISIGTHAISTYNPGSSEQTNIWPYSDIFSIQPSPKSNNEFRIFVRKKPGKPAQEGMLFSCEHRLELLTNALKHYPKFVDKNRVEFPRYRAVKIHWSEHRVEVYLIITPCSIDQYTLSGKKLCSYDFKDIVSIAKVQDYPGGFVIITGNTGRMHLFGTDKLEDLFKNVEKTAMAGMGLMINTQKKVIAQADFASGRLGSFSDDQSLTSFTEFNVYKRSIRHSQPVSRIFCLTESCIVERDPSTYNVCTVKPLTDIWSIIRHTEDPQLFSIELLSGQTRSYTCTDRDSLLASIIDGARGNKNKDICVQSSRTNLGARIGPLFLPVEEVTFDWFDYYLHV